MVIDKTFNDVGVRQAQATKGTLTSGSRRIAAEDSPHKSDKELWVWVSCLNSWSEANEHLKPVASSSSLSLAY